MTDGAFVFRLVFEPVSLSGFDVYVSVLSLAASFSLHSPLAPPWFLAFFFLVCLFVFGFPCFGVYTYLPVGNGL